jgi:hypothetical protein
MIHLHLVIKADPKLGTSDFGVAHTLSLQPSPAPEPGIKDVERPGRLFLVQSRVWTLLPPLLGERPGNPDQVGEGSQRHRGCR